MRANNEIIPVDAVISSDAATETRQTYFETLGTVHHPSIRHATLRAMRVYKCVTDNAESFRNGRYSDENRVNW